MGDSSSHIHIVTLGTNVSMASVSRPKSAMDVRGKRKSSLRYGSAAVYRNRSNNSGKDSEKEAVPVPLVKTKSADPAKVHNHDVVFDASAITLSNRSTDTVRSSPSSPEEHPRSLINHSSNFPVGAHTSGYYSRLRNEQNKFGAKGASVNIATLIQNITLPPSRTDSGPPIEEDIGGGRRGNKARPRATIVFPNNNEIMQIGGGSEWKPEPDIETIEDLLAQLSDFDNSVLKLSESLSELVALTETETGKHNRPESYPLDTAYL